MQRGNRKSVKKNQFFNLRIILENTVSPGFEGIKKKISRFLEEAKRSKKSAYFMEATAVLVEFISTCFSAFAFGVSPAVELQL